MEYYASMCLDKDLESWLPINTCAKMEVRNQYPALIVLTSMAWCVSIVAENTVIVSGARGVGFS